MTENGNEEENALILDPCVKEDVNLISFEGNRVISTSTKEIDIIRVSVTRRIFNLDDTFIKAERGKVWDGVEKTLSEYSAGDITEKVCLRILSDYIASDALFSACAIACVNSLAPDYIKEKLDLTL